MSAEHKIQEGHEGHHKEHHALVPTIVLAIGFYALIAWMAPMLTLQKLDIVMILIGALLFVALQKGLAIVLFEPYLKLLEAREAATVGAVKSATALVEQADQLKSKLEAQILQARAQAMQQKNESMLRTKEEVNKLLEKADMEAQEIIRASRWENAKNAEQIRGNLQSQVETLAQTLVQRITV